MNQPLWAKKNQTIPHCCALVHRDCASLYPLSATIQFTAWGDSQSQQPVDQIQVPSTYQHGRVCVGLPSRTDWSFDGEPSWSSQPCFIHRDHTHRGVVWLQTAGETWASPGAHRSCCCNYLLCEREPRDKFRQRVVFARRVNREKKQKSASSLSMQYWRHNIDIEELTRIKRVKRIYELFGFFCFFVLLFFWQNKVVYNIRFFVPMWILFLIFSCHFRAPGGLSRFSLNDISLLFFFCAVDESMKWRYIYFKR